MRLSHIGRMGSFAALLISVCFGLLVACGGTQVAGGVGSGGSGVAEGSVSGFGSVIVDGVAYGDSSAVVTRWGEDGVAEAKLGQRVRVLLDDSGQASRIVVLPQLIGQASTAPDAQGDFVMLGQRVRVVGADDINYAATVFEGLTQVGAGDALEVHGSWARDEQGRSLLIASRIEKLNNPADPVLVTALVDSRLGKTLTLDDADHTPVSVSSLPDNVQAGTLVSLWLPAQTVLTPASIVNPWLATRAELASATTDNGTTLALRGVVSDADSQQARIRVQGLWVKLPANASTVPPVGASVQLTVQRSGNDWQATDVQVVSRSVSQPDVELKGSLLWSSNASTVALRGTTVQLPADLLVNSCGGLKDGEEVYISLKAQRRSPGQLPKASEIECTRQIPDASVQEAKGVLLTVDQTSKTVRVQVGNSTLMLTWVNGRTLMPANSTTLLNKRVEIEYQRSNTGLLLRKLKPE